VIFDAGFILNNFQKQEKLAKIRALLSESNVSGSALAAKKPRGKRVGGKSQVFMAEEVIQIKDTVRVSKEAAAAKAVKKKEGDAANKKNLTKQLKDLKTTVTLLKKENAKLTKENRRYKSAANQSGEISESSDEESEQKAVKPKRSRAKASVKSEVEEEQAESEESSDEESSEDDESDSRVMLRRARVTIKASI
jgi:hypothetical protein